MENGDRAALRDLTAKFGDAKVPLPALGQSAAVYGVLLREALARSREQVAARSEERDPTRLASGHALSPYYAALCMEDQLRTVAFVRGALQAIEFLLGTTSRRPLHLLEAGCGPLGTLVLPLLARFGSEELEVSLIDLHQEAIDSVRSLLNHFGFGDRVRHLHCGDATTISLESPPDVILTETMNRALFGEPQVEITRSLVQRYPDALLLPERVEVNLSLLDTNAEAQSFPMQAGERIELGSVFVLDRSSAAGFPPAATSLPAASLRLPGTIDPRFYPFLTTRVTIFDDLTLGDYDSAITIPVSLDLPVDNLPRGAELHFSYALGEHPGLRWLTSQDSSES